MEIPPQPPTDQRSSKPFSLSNISNYHGRGFFSLPKELIARRFTEVEREVNTRWDEYKNETSFPKYVFEKSDAEISKEFKIFDQMRRNLHANLQATPFQSNPDFTIAQNILIHHRFRQPNTITFEHSKADDSYNCSCVTISGRKFFALEGPTEDTLEYFYRLLTNWDVHTLVCLTDKEENGIPKCFPYWLDHTFELGGETFFQLPLEDQYERPLSDWDKKGINYTHIPQWKDHSGLDVEALVSEANQTRKRTNPDEIMAIHCSAGVGRTGTFLAMTCLLEEIDKQVASGINPEDVELNIAELFLRLNFFRRPLVATEPQYITIHKAVDYYLKQLMTNSDK